MPTNIKPRINGKDARSLYFPEVKNSTYIHMLLALIQNKMARLIYKSTVLRVTYTIIKAMVNVGMIMAIPSQRSSSIQQLSFTSQKTMCRFSCFFMFSDKSINQDLKISFLGILKPFLVSLEII